MFQSPINILSSQGAYIENITESRVDVNGLMTPFTSGHEFSFEFSTRKSNGVLFYLTRNDNDLDLIAVVLNSGYLRYHIRCSAIDAKLVVPVKKFDDGQFHSIRFRRKGRRGLLFVDGKRHFHNYAIDCGGFTSLTFGGVKQHHHTFKRRLLTHPHHLEGCIRHVDISTGINTFPHYTAVSECR